MSEEAAHAAALEAYADAIREYNEQQQQQQQMGDDNLSAVAAAASLPFNFAVDDEEVQYLMSMEEKASMMLMERLTNDINQAVNNNNNINNNNNNDSNNNGNISNNNPQQMNEILLQELIGLAGGSQGTDDAMAQHLLSILEQQKHQNNVAYDVPPEKTVISNRPEKHFFTVAQDGTDFLFVRLCRFGYR